MTMRHRLAVATFLALLLGPLGAPASAHHSRAAYADDEITLEGTVTGYIWRNPHVQIQFDVRSANGEVEHWSGELSAVTSMIAAGLARDTFQPGDTIRVEAQPARSGDPFCVLGSIWKNGEKVLDGNYRAETR